MKYIIDTYNQLARHMNDGVHNQNYIKQSHLIQGIKSEY
jgi:hypothetical protein